jgi:glycosyltransferase involved in cell wall biosynthesis
MATYNRAHFIVETLESIHKQTFKDWECLIIDDGGTDNTKETIEPLLSQDSRFKFLKRPSRYKKGLPGCRNYGLNLATGDYIIFFDDDDIVHPRNLEHCVHELENAEFDFCRYNRDTFKGTFKYDFDELEPYNRFTICDDDLLKILNNQLPFNSCAVMWRANCFKNNRFVEQLMYAEEWELYSRIISQGYKGVSIAKTLFYGRKHEQSNTGEFDNGNPIRMASKVEASILVISNLNKRGLLSAKIQKYFTWEAVRLNTLDIHKHLLKQSSVSFSQRIKAVLLYTLSPLIKIYLKIKKNA